MIEKFAELQSNMVNFISVSVDTNINTNAYSIKKKTGFSNKWKESEGKWHELCRTGS